MTGKKVIVVGHIPIGATTLIIDKAMRLIREAMNDPEACVVFNNLEMPVEEFVAREYVRLDLIEPPAFPEMVIKISDIEPIADPRFERERVKDWQQRDRHRSKKDLRGKWRR